MRTGLLGESPNLPERTRDVQALRKEELWFEQYWRCSYS